MEPNERKKKMAKCRGQTSEFNPASSRSKWVVPVLGELISRGDGTFVLKPRIPECDLDTWITIAQAAEVIGMKARSVYPLLGEYLVFRRPLPSRILISLKSALAYKQATLDPEFWTQTKFQERVKHHVRQTMDRMAGAALETLDAAQP